MNRVLHSAFLLSLALHGVILHGVALQRDAARREPVPGPIAARLVEPPPPPPQAMPQQLPSPRAPAEPPPASSKPAPQPKVAAPKAKAVPKPRTIPEAAPESIAEAVNPVSPLEAPPAPGSSAVEPQPKPSAPIASAPVQPPGPSAEQLEARSREQYRLQVLHAARSHNRYPRLARENNWEGEVQVRLVIGSNGSLASVAIRESSGHPVLDRQALEMFRRAQAAVPLPDALRGREFSLDLKAIYSLRDQVSG